MVTLPGKPQRPFFIGFNFFIDRIAIMKLVAAANGAVMQGAQSITLCISSNGGSTEQAFYAYEILRALPVPVHAINLSIVQSAANIIFMAGEQRTATPESHFLLHQTKFSPTTGGNYAPADLAFSSAAVKSDDARMAQIVAERTGRPIAHVRRWFSGQKIRTTEFALTNGIIQGVGHLQMPVGAEFFQVTL